MLKTLVILLAVLIAVVNISAQTSGAKRPYVTRKPVALRLGPPTTYLKEGLTTQEVVKLLGEPTSILDREDNGVAMKTYEFPRGGNRILVADFVNGALINSRIETRQAAEAGR
jgi:hypothetical protein